MELKEIKGINARQMKLLTEAGISTVETLGMTPGKEVSNIDGIGEQTALKLIWKAREILGMTDFNKAKDIQNTTEYISTGSSEVNRILGGSGIHTEVLTEIFGAFKSGKTAQCHTCAVTVQLPKEKGGLGANAAWLDTENTFSREKTERIAKRFGLNPDEVLSNIYHVDLYSSDHQKQLIQKVENLCKEKNVRLIIVDSLMALLRAEYVGLGQLAPRQALLNNMIHVLSRIAKTYKVAVMLTNQVSVQMKGSFSTNDACGGNIVAHGCHIRVKFHAKGFQANKGLERTAVIVDAADLPPEECKFFITGVGVADSDKVDEAPKKSEKIDSKKSEKIDSKKSEKIDSKNLYEPLDEETEEAISGTPLKNIKGIGPSVAGKLEKVNIFTAEDLANAEENAENIAGGLPKISPSMLLDFIKEAKNIVKA